MTQLDPIEMQFQQDESGREIFYPRGRWSTGFLVPSREEGQRIRAALRRRKTAFLVATIGLAVLLKGYAVVALPVVLVANIISYRRMVGREVAAYVQVPACMTRAQWRRQVARVIGYGRSALSLAGLLLFLSATPLMWEDIGWLVAVYVGIIVFGFGYYVMLLALKVASRGSQDPTLTGTAPN